MTRKIWMLNVMLLAGSLVMAAGTYRFWWDRPSDESASLVSEEGPGKRTVQAYGEIPPPPDRQDFRIIEEANLFSENRSPVKSEVITERTGVPMEDPQNRYVLYGIIKLGEDSYYAIIKDKKSPNAQPFFLAEGDNLSAGESVKDIDDDRILISSGGGESELRLRSPKGPEDTSFTPRPVTPAPAAVSPEKTEMTIPTQQKTPPSMTTQPKTRPRPRRSTSPGMEMDMNLVEEEMESNLEGIKEDIIEDRPFD